MLTPFGPRRPFDFGSVMLVNQPRFCQLLRYYVFSTATGADYIFAFRTTQRRADALSMIYDASIISPWHMDRLIMQRMRGVLDWYIQLCYHTMKQARKRPRDVTPEDDLALMTSFWQEYADG